MNTGNYTAANNFSQGPGNEAIFCVPAFNGWEHTQPRLVYGLAIGDSLVLYGISPSPIQVAGIDNTRERPVWETENMAETSPQNRQATGSEPLPAICFFNNAFYCRNRGRRGKRSYEPFINFSPFKCKIMATTNGVTADRIQHDPAFERTRENTAEFGRAGKGTSLVRNVFRELLINVTDRNFTGRLVRALYQVAVTDTVSARGERTLNRGEVGRLRNFNFNNRASLIESLHTQNSVTIDKVTGQVTVSIPGFVPRFMVQGPGSATHFKIRAAAAVIDFDNDSFEMKQQATAELPWNNIAIEAINMQLSLAANSPNPILVVLSITYYQEVNGAMYPLKSGKHNAAAIVQAVK